MGTGTGLDQQDSVIACKAFVCASQNAISGNSQNAAVFQLQVYGQYKTLIMDSKDSGSALLTQRNARSI